MRGIYFFIGIGILLTFSCKGSKSVATQAEIDALNTIVKTKTFSIDSNTAYPQTTFAMQQVLSSGLMQPGSTPNAISLIGNSNFLTISGDSISSYLPYFGERQMHIAYNGNDSAIQFDGLLEDYTVVQKGNNSYSISFRSKSKSEDFRVFIELYPNLRARINLNGSSRFPISYSGFVKPIKKDKP